MPRSRIRENSGSELQRTDFSRSQLHSPGDFRQAMQSIGCETTWSKESGRGRGRDAERHRAAVRSTVPMVRIVPLALKVAMVQNRQLS